MCASQPSGSSVYCSTSSISKMMLQQCSCLITEIDWIELSWTLGKVILFTLGYQPKEMDANVVLNINRIWVQVMVRDVQGHKMKVQAENAEVK
jgi:hypothetical protein